MRLTGILAGAVLLNVVPGCGYASAQVPIQQNVSGSSQPLDPLYPPAATSYPKAMPDWDALVTLFEAHRPIPEAQLKAFVQAVDNDLPDRMPDDEPVCSATFARLAPDSTPALIATRDVNGRDFCNDLFVITRTEKAVIEQGLRVLQVDDVQDVLVDLRHDGNLELVVPTEASEYEGANSCMANWTRVLTLDHGKLADQSRNFTNFYRTTLDTLTKGVPTATAEDEGDGRDRAICMQMEANRIERFLGIDPTAGEESAMAWVKSSNEFLRRKGVVVLGDIGDKKSNEVLRELTQDSDVGVSITAKQCLGEKVY
jgi:hypothetical protein